MTRDDIIRMAREAGVVATANDGLHIFAALVAEQEREQIAKRFDGPVWSYDYREIAAAIRARGQA
jgi:hypothetical protein